ncbi:MAG: hypothetical protein ACK5IC_00945 [Moheibacter sp.]
MLDISTKSWFRFGLISLVLVALFGTLMRYKIVFDFPFFNQKNLLHAHSHFAFAGWVSHFLYTGITNLLLPYLNIQRKKIYNFLILLNMICAFGMLISFTIQGYALFSITFSTLSIFISIAFGLFFWMDSRKKLIDHPSKPWANTGLFLNIISCAGPFYLAYMLASKQVNHEFYISSIYYYLHFQYSGWFFFGSMALIVSKLPKDFPRLNQFHKLFTLTIIPTFFLSVLWLELPLWLYIITVLATFIQLFAWIRILQKGIYYIKTKGNVFSIPKWISIFFYVATISLTLKFILQAISVIPDLSELVFGLRPIIIAYLHLVLLGVYSSFIIGYLFSTLYLNSSKLAKISALIFLVGIFLNELFLGTQGFAAFAYVPIPYVNECLLLAAIVLFVSANGLALSQFITSSKISKSRD